MCISSILRRRICISARWKSYDDDPAILKSIDDVNPPPDFARRCVDRIRCPEHEVPASAPFAPSASPVSALPKTGCHGSPGHFGRFDAMAGVWSQ
jgi:hypothetical protein